MSYIQKDRSVKEGNQIISDFIGKVDEFHCSWDKLIPVIRKWDNLPLSHNRYYVLLADELDNKVTLYEIEDVFHFFVHCLSWYNYEILKNRKEKLERLTK